MHKVEKERERRINNPKNKRIKKQKGNVCTGNADDPTKIIQADSEAHGIS